MDIKEGLRGRAEKRFKFENVALKGLVVVDGLGGGPPSVSAVGIASTDTLRFTQLVSLRTSRPGRVASCEVMEVGDSAFNSIGASSDVGEDDVVS